MPEGKGKVIRKRIIRWCVRAAVIIFCAAAVSLLAAPAVMVHELTDGHVNYPQVATDEQPMPGVYRPQDFDLDATEVYFATSDGHMLWASEVYVERPKAVIVYLTGLHYPSVTYFYGHAALMRDNGYASILLETRAHGKSSGTRLTYGYEELSDIDAVLLYLNNSQRFKDVPVVLHGVSMGATAAINAFGQRPEIDGVIAMSAYSRAEDYMYEYMLSLGVPKFLCDIEKPITAVYLRALFNTAVDELSPVIQAANIGDRPALLIAASGDTQVLPENTLEIAENAPPQTEVWIRNTDAHFIIKNNDFKNVSEDTVYCQKILDFIRERVVGA